MAEMMSSSCLKLIAKIDERDQDAILARLDELQAQGVPAKRAQLRAAIDVLARLEQQSDPNSGADAPNLRFSRRRGPDPENTVTAYKLFRVDAKKPGKLFPLFVNANDPIDLGVWLDADEGPMQGGKVKSKLGPLAYRPGWHAGDLPIATHIGGKSEASLTKPDLRPDNQVWAEVEMAADVDWQTEANKRGTNASGKLVPVKAHITDRIPVDGFYRYKTNPNMTGNWLIGGSMKVNRILSDAEVEAVNKAAGVSDLRRETPFDAAKYGFNNVQGDPDGKGITRSRQRNPQEDAPDFKAWFKQSKAVDEDGNPMVMYHGTAYTDENGNALTEFRPGHADAIYLTPRPEFASGFAQSGGQGANVLPVYVSTQNPFNYENPEHREALRKFLEDKVGAEGKVTIEAPRVPAMRLSPADLANRISKGQWMFVESPAVQEFIRANHDGFYTNERGTKNLAVFRSEQVKSATGNDGGFDATNPDIRRSRQRSPSEIFGQDVAPVAIRAYKSLSIGAKSIVDGWNMNWDKHQGRLRNSEDWNELVKAYEPVRQRLRQIYGDNVPAFRGEKQGGKESGDDRFLFSWTPLRDLATIFAINRSRGMPPEIPQSKVDEQVAHYKKTGIARLNGYEYVRKDPGSYQLDGPDYYYIYQRGEMLTDGDDIAKALQSEKEERDEWIDTLRSSGKLYAADIPVDSVAFVPVGSNLRHPEFVAEYNPRKDSATEIKFSKRRNELGFYSALADSIDGINIKQAPAGAWKTALKGLVNKGAIKQDELFWTGLEDWMDLQQGKVSKQQVSEYLDANGVKVEEVVLGENGYDAYGQLSIQEGSYGDSWMVVDEEGRVIGDEHDTREEAQAALDSLSRAAPSKYKTYTLPGGENYREVLLTLPTKRELPSGYRVIANPSLSRTAKKFIIIDEAGERYGSGDTEQEALDRYFQHHAKNEYKSAHWDQPNVLAHIRVDDRIDADGKRVLFVEEVQSDWGQEGKKRGFKQGDVFSGGQLTYDPDERDRLQPAPFVTKTEGWLNLALKRIMAMAVDGGYDRVAFVNGEQSADRYDLSRQVDSISYEPTAKGYYINVMADGRNIKNGDFTADELEDIVGKELVQKMEAREGKAEVEPGSPDYEDLKDVRVLRGDGLKVGGEGMKTFYDRIVPNATNALLKKVSGEKLGMIDIPDAFNGRDIVAAQIPGESGWGLYDRHSGRWLDEDEARVSDPEEAMQYSERAAREMAAAIMRDSSTSLRQPGFDVTPRLIESATQGFTLFSRARQVNDAADYSTDILGEAIQKPRRSKPAPAAELPPGEYAVSTTLVTTRKQKIGTKQVKTSQDAADALHYLTRGAVERFDAIVTNAKGKPLAIIGGFKGAVSQASVYPATIMGEAIQIPGAANIWFVHNHPSGSSDLSAADHNLHKLLSEVFDGSGITPRELLAVTRSEWSDTAGATDLPNPRDDGATVPVQEREIVRDERLGFPIESPRFALKAAQELARRNGNRPGLMLLNARNAPVAYVPWEPAGTEILKEQGRLGSLYRAVSEANASSVILVDPMGEFGRQQWRNLAKAFKQADVSMLDVMQGERSIAETDGLGFPPEILRSKRRNPQEDTPEFKRWFGNSKVVDANGKPLVVYHGTSADFDAFKMDGPVRNMVRVLITSLASKVNADFSTRRAKEAATAWFTASPGLAADYATVTGVEGANVMPVYLSIQRPLILDHDAKTLTFPDGRVVRGFAVTRAASFNNEGLLDAARRSGADGLIIKGSLDGAAEVGQTPADVYVAFRPEQIKSATGNSGNFDSANPDIRKSPTRAYHGTHQRGIEKFDTNKVGSGEGAQMYGWGLYFASLKDVAEYYREMLSSKRARMDVKLDGEPFKSNAIDRAVQRLIAAARSVDGNSLVAEMRAAAKRNKMLGMKDVATENESAINAIEGAKSVSIKFSEKNGQLYEVLLPDEAEMLDFDSPLDEQPQAFIDAVRRAAEKAADSEIRDRIDSGVRSRLPAAEVNGDDFMSLFSDANVDASARAEKMIQEEIAAYPGREALIQKNIDSITRADANGMRTGKSFYKSLSSVLGSDRAASEYLLDLGVRGIKYLDGGSRDSGTGSHNYVIFSGDDVEIQRTYYSRGRTSTGAAWDSPSAEKFDDLVYRLQDKQIDTKRVVEAIKEASGAIADDLNVYLREELFHGRAAKRTEDFANMELTPLIEQLQRDGLKLEELEEYLHARHAPEANRIIAQRNPGQPGLQDGGSGMMTQDALNYMASLPADLRQKLDAAAQRVDDIIKNTRQMYVDYELESQDTINAWDNMFQHYIPLQREDKDGAPGLGQGFSIKGREAKGRTGSTRKVVDILANIALQRERAIVRGEKNRVSQALHGLAAANPNPDFWEVDVVPTERVFNPNTGLVEDRADPLYKSRENAVIAKIKDANGKVREHAVLFSEEDERAMRMAAALKNLDAAQLEGLLGVSAKISRYFAAVNTQYNPVFGVVNLVRDVQGALLNLSNTPLADDRAKITKYTLSAMRGIYSDMRAARRGQNLNSQWAALWDDFAETGGQTGYREMFANSADRSKVIRKALDPDAWMNSRLGKIFTINGALKVPMAQARRAAKWLFDWLSDYNETFENGVRLAAYKAGIERGLSKDQAASIAKNLTVNFNRKGQVALQAGALYAFFNASIQGTARIGQTLFDMDAGKPKTLRLSAFGKKVVYGGMLLGSMQAMLLAAAGFNDDDPPEFARERSLILPIGGGKYITVPMPLGFHVIPAIGRMTTEFALSGFKDPHKRAVALASMFADTFNPIGNAGLSMQTLAPTALDPLVALTENKDYTGKPIARESSNKAIPGHALGRDTATSVAKFLSEAVNTLSGGNEYRAGVFSPTPDQIDYLIGQATGGVGRELSKVEQSTLAVARGEALPTYKVPLVGRFVGDAKSQASEGTAFYANTERLNELETEIKGLQKDGKFAEAAELRRSRSDSYLITMANQAERQIQRLRQQKRELIKSGADREQVKAIEDQVTAAMARLNRAAESLREKQEN